MNDKLKFPVKIKNESRRKRERTKKKAEKLLCRLENGESVRLYDFSPRFAVSVLLAYAGFFAIDIYFIVTAERRAAAIVAGAVLLVSLLALLWYFLVNAAVLDVTGIRRGRLWISKREAYWYSEYHERFKEQKIYVGRRVSEQDEATEKKTSLIVFQCLSQYPAALEYILGEPAEAPRKPFIRGKR